MTVEDSARNGGYDYDFTYDGGSYGASTGAGSPTFFKTYDINYNSDDQIAYSNDSFLYDGNGNATTLAGSTVAFDPENRLTSVTTPWEEEMSAAYNGDNQRVQKTDDEEGSYNLYLYDGDQMVEETYGTGAPWAYHTYGPAGLVSSNFGGTTTFFAFDPQGNVSERMNSSGSVTSYDVYDAFGDYSTTDTAYTNQNFGAQWGYFYDYETGLLLTGQRYRPAGHDEFVTRDPSGYAGGINLYDYTGNNPVNEIDPSGLRELGSLPSNGPDGLPFPPGTRFHPDPDNPAHDPHWDIDIPQNDRSGDPRINDGSTEWRYYPMRNRARGHWQEKAGSKARRANREAAKQNRVSKSCPYSLLSPQLPSMPPYVIPPALMPPGAYGPPHYMPQPSETPDWVPDEPLFDSDPNWGTGGYLMGPVYAFWEEVMAAGL